jgi:hypothetical protein
VELATDLCVVLRLRIHHSVLPLLQTSFWCGVYLIKQGNNIAFENEGSFSAYSETMIVLFLEDHLKEI